MSAYRHFRLSLQAEFKRKVYRQVHALWADLSELKEAEVEADRAIVLQQIRQRICALEQAACAVEIDELPVIGKPGVRRLGASRVRLSPLLRPFATERLA